MSSTAVGRSRRARSRTSAPGCGSRASAGSSRRSPGSSSSRSKHGPRRRPDHPPQDRRSSTSSRRACARSATRASRRSRRARRRPSTRYMKMATSEAGKAAYELGMEIGGPFGAGHRPELGAEHGPLVARLLHVVREHDRGRQLRDPAQHHRPARARAPEGLTRRWTSPSPTTSSSCATPRASCSTASARPRSCARTSTIPSVYEPLWRHLQRVHRARRRPRDRPLPVPRADRLRRRARAVPRDRAATRRSPATTARPPARSRSSTIR